MNHRGTAVDDIDRLSVWAVRYALGRATYAVSDVVEVLLRNMAALSPSSKRAIVKSIEDASERGGLGMDMDARQWQRLYAACQSSPAQEPDGATSPRAQ